MRVCWMIIMSLSFPCITKTFDSSMYFPGRKFYRCGNVRAIFTQYNKI
ncbi:hypothetical protein KP509_02G083000 [Ceratopteris richardii]|uniref:Uncharacterized protein n=1 Tax=Ceratopteris richardii TaxID=49495 RepID=A0A8T2VBT4_CERRI|nr:hypothetical protein KP509_02G083000 [Ceratopteris richardii]